MEHITVTTLTKLRNDMATEFAAGHDTVHIGPKRGEELTTAINHLLNELTTRGQNQATLEKDLEQKVNRVRDLEGDLHVVRGELQLADSRIVELSTKFNAAESEASSLRDINAQLREQMVNTQDQAVKVANAEAPVVDPAPAAEPAPQV